VNEFLGALDRIDVSVSVDDFLHNPHGVGNVVLGARNINLARFNVIVHMHERLSFLPNLR